MKKKSLESMQKTRKSPVKGVNKFGVLMTLAGAFMFILMVFSFIPSLKRTKTNTRKSIPDHPEIDFKVPDEPVEDFALEEIEYEYEEPSEITPQEVREPVPFIEPPTTFLARFPRNAASSSLNAFGDDNGPIGVPLLDSINQGNSNAYLLDSVPETTVSLTENTATIYDAYAQANNQGQKTDFAQSTPGGVSEILTEFSIAPGTVIPAILVSGINTDLPGYIIAQITTGVYDYVTGQNLLIPQGSRLIATYNSVVSFGQSRVQIAWEKLITPEGLVIDMGRSPATDPEGYSGAKGRANNHLWQVLGAMGFSALTSTIAGVGTNIVDKLLQSGAVQASLEELIDSYGALGHSIAQRWLNVQPTITMNSGSRLNVLVEKSLTLPPAQKAGYPKKYNRK